MKNFLNLQDLIIPCFNEEIIIDDFIDEHINILQKLAGMEMSSLMSDKSYK